MVFWVGVIGIWRDRSECRIDDNATSSDASALARLLQKVG